MYIVTANNQGNPNQKSVQQTSATFDTLNEATDWAKNQATRNLQHKYTIYKGVFSVFVELPQPTVKLVDLV